MDQSGIADKAQIFLLEVERLMTDIENRIREDESIDSPFVQLEAI